MARKRNLQIEHSFHSDMMRRKDIRVMRVTPFLVRQLGTRGRKIPKNAVPSILSMITHRASAVFPGTAYVRPSGEARRCVNKSCLQKCILL